MSIIFSATFAAASQLSKIIVGFLFLKIIAVYLGVEGMGQLGHFMSVVTVVSLLAGGGILNGIIKYVAEYGDDLVKLRKFMIASKSYALAFCVAIFFVGVCFSKSISMYVFKTESYYFVIILLSFSQFGYAFVQFVIGVVNGLGNTKAYAKIQIIGNLLIIPITWPLIKYYGFYGASISMVLYFLLPVIPAFIYYKGDMLFRRISSFDFRINSYKRLIPYSIMAVSGAVSVPIVEVLIRELVIEGVGYEAAGIWQSSLRLSGAYVGFFVVFLLVYFMPIISSKSYPGSLKGIVFKFITIVMAVFSIGGVSFYFMKGWVIPLLLSSEFTELEFYIHYQLIGDFFRVSAYVIGFVVIAKSALSVYLVSEVSQGALLYFFNVYFMSSGFQLQGVFLAHMIMNIVYFFCAVLFFLIYLKKSRNGKSEC